MAGLTRDAPTPTEILLHQKSRVLEIAFSDGKRFRLPCEFLRVYSPSAEVRGHGPGQEVLQVGKKDVEITELDNTAMADAVKKSVYEKHAKPLIPFIERVQAVK